MAGILGGDFDPRTAGLLAAGLGILSGSGPSRAPTSVGQLIGQGGMQGLNEYQQALEQQRRGAATEGLLGVERQKIMQMAQQLEILRRQDAIKEGILREAGILPGSQGAAPGAGSTPTAPGMSPSTSTFAFGSPQFATAPTPALASVPPVGQNPTGLDPRKLFALKAGGIGDFTDVYNASKPELEFKDGVWYDKRTGIPVRAGMGINAQGQGYRPIIGPNGELSVGPLPGADELLRQQQRIGEEEKARLDLVTRPALGPNQPPTYANRLDLARPQQQALAPGGITAQGEGPAGGVNFQNATPDQILSALKAAPELATVLADALRRGTGQAPAASPAVAPAPATAATPPFAAAPSNAAGMSPQATATQAADAAQQMEISKKYGEFYNTWQQSLMSNPPRIAKLDQLSNLLGDFEGGKASGFIKDVQSLANSFNIKLGDNLSEKEASIQLTNGLALEQRQGGGSGVAMPGAMSDADREFLKAMAPGLNQTAEGRKIIIDTQRALLQREMDIADMARKYRQRHGTIGDDFFNKLNEWSSRNRMFAK